MENQNDENFEDCQEKQEIVSQDTDKKDPTEKPTEPKNLSEEKADKESKEEKQENSDIEEDKPPKEHLPFSMSNARKTSSESEEEEDTKLTQEEKAKIEENIIQERKNAGELYKNQNYISALNIYSTLLKDAKRAGLKDQCCILYCNKGICFNKLNKKDKALEAFTVALRYDKDNPKALCNKMLLHNSKEEYLEAYEDFQRLKTLDYDLWCNYRYMEGKLAYNAEIKKKQMTDEMLGKLKTLGNSILGNFGISLDNFKMTPNGQGGYSIQYNNGK